MTTILLIQSSYATKKEYGQTAKVIDLSSVKTEIKHPFKQIFYGGT